MYEIQYIDTKKVIDRLGLNPSGRVQAFFTATCYKQMGRYIVGGSGSQLNKNVSITSNTITYMSPYAHYQWYGKVMSPNIPIMENGEVVGWFSPKGKKKTYTDRTLNTRIGTNQWDKKMWSSDKEEVIKQVERYMGVNR